MNDIEKIVWFMKEKNQRLKQHFPDVGVDYFSPEDEKSLYRLFDEKKANKFWKDINEKSKISINDMDFCPFCFIHNKDCNVCDYGIRHIQCENPNSTYKLYLNQIIKHADIDHSKKRSLSAFLDIDEILMKIEKFEKYLDRFLDFKTNRYKGFYCDMSDKTYPKEEKIRDYKNYCRIKTIEGLVLIERLVLINQSKERGKGGEMREETIEDYKKVVDILEKINIGVINPRKMVFRIAAIFPSLIVKASKGDLTKEDVL